MCCFNCEVGNMQCTLKVYVDDLPVTCKDEATIARGIEAAKAEYHEVQEHTGVRHSYLRMCSRLVGSRGVLYHYDYVQRAGIKGCRIGECGHPSIRHVTHNQGE